MEYLDLYELMRAYKDSKLLVNKRLIGGKVSRFVDLPNSYRQIVRDKEGRETYYQFFEFGVPFYLKREKAIEKYLRRLGEPLEEMLLDVSDEEIEKFNQYWDLEFIGRTVDFKERNSAMLITPSGKKYCFSLEEGKELNDAFQVMFKPLPYTGGRLR